MSLQLIFILILCGVMTNIMSAIFWHRWRRIDGTYSLHLIPTVPFTMIAATSLTMSWGHPLLT